MWLCTHARIYARAPVRTHVRMCVRPCVRTRTGTRLCVCVCMYVCTPSARVPPPRCSPCRRGLWPPLPAVIWGWGQRGAPPPTAGPGSAAARLAPSISAVAASTQGRTAGDAGWMRMRDAGCGCSRCFPRSARCAPSSLPPCEISLSCCHTLEMSNVSASACGPMPPPGPLSCKLFFFVVFFPPFFPFPFHPFALSSSLVGMEGCFPQPAGIEK